MDSQATITQRVREIFEELVNQRKIKSNRDFFKPLGIDDSVGSIILSTTAKNKRQFPKGKYELLLKTWEVNPDFLYLGKGKMFLHGVSNNVLHLNVFTEASQLGEIEMDLSQAGMSFIEMGDGSKLMLVPLVEEYAQAGYLAGFSDETAEMDEYLKGLPKHPIIVDKYHKGKYFAFRIVGDSMNDGTQDSITADSVVVGREIPKDLWRSRFHLHRYQDYVIVHKEGILLKRIIEHNVEAGIIRCLSLNPDKDRYPDFDINLDEVSQMLNVVNITTVRRY